MTVLVGYVSSKGGQGALNLGLLLANGLGLPLKVATVIPHPWPVPSMARVDAEYAEWARELAAESERSAREHLEPLLGGKEVEFVTLTDSSASRALIAAAAEATVLVLGSSHGHPGQVAIGSTTGRLLHSAPVPLAIAPLGFELPASGAVPRVTCAYSGHVEGTSVVDRAAALAADNGVPLRLATFAVGGKPMVSSQLGLSYESQVLAAIAEQAKATLDALAVEAAERVVGTGTDWQEALDDLAWLDGELLIVGSSTATSAERVFLGSRASRLVRHSPVPVIVLPG